MIVQERISIDGAPYVHSYSDKGYLLVDQDGGLYGECWDKEPTDKTYTERIPDGPIELDEIYDILVRGVTE